MTARRPLGLAGVALGGCIVLAGPSAAEECSSGARQTFDRIRGALGVLQLHLGDRLRWPNPRLHDFVGWAVTSPPDTCSGTPAAPGGEVPAVVLPLDEATHAVIEKHGLFLRFTVRM